MERAKVDFFRGTSRFRLKSNIDWKYDFAALLQGVEEGTRSRFFEAAHLFYFFNYRLEICFLCFIVEKCKGVLKVTLALRSPKGVVRPGRWSF